MKRVFSVLLTVMLLVSMIPCSVAAAGRDVSYEETLAADLKELAVDFSFLLTVWRSQMPM